jgi:hypothetical protein
MVVPWPDMAARTELAEETRTRSTRLRFRCHFLRRDHSGVGSSPGWVSQHVAEAYVMHDGRTESLTFGGATSLLQWTDGAGTGSNGCGDCVSLSAWCCWSLGSVVAMQQWKG